MPSLLVLISKGVKEYCLMKIATALDSSPKVCNYFGFDLIVYSDCVQFAMEKC